MTPRDYWIGWSIFGVAAIVVAVAILVRLDRIIALLEKRP